jgi:hypothetical protein
MALRLLEMVLQEKDGSGVRALLNECKVLEHRQIRLADGEVLVRISRTQRDHRAPRPMQPIPQRIEAGHFPNAQVHSCRPIRTFRT